MCQAVVCELWWVHRLGSVNVDHDCVCVCAGVCARVRAHTWVGCADVLIRHGRVCGLPGGGTVEGQGEAGI